MDENDKDAIGVDFEQAYSAGGCAPGILRSWCNRYPALADDFLTIAVDITTGALSDERLNASEQDDATIVIGMQAVAEYCAITPQHIEPLRSLKPTGLTIEATAKLWRLDEITAAKIERRLVLLKGFPTALAGMIAMALQRPVDDVLSYLRGTPRLATAQFKAAQSPKLVKQTFIEAIQASKDIQSADKDFWTNEVFDGRVLEENYPIDLGK